MDDVVLNKAAVIERCIQRVRQEQAGLETELARQDSVILNLQRACEAAIDLAMHLVQALSLPIVRSIVAGRLDELLQFSSLAVRTWG